MDFNKMPKVICESWHQNNNKAWFFFGFSSGIQESAYLVAPQAAKGFLIDLEKRIKKYEAEHGEIDMKGFKTAIQSPIQMQ